MGSQNKYEFAYDFDLFYKLSKVGGSTYIDSILSSHRWHKESLTVSRRWDSVKEASRVRVSELPKTLKVCFFLWEVPVVLLTYFGGVILERNASKSNKAK